MITFEKEYTRDFTLIMAQLWLYSLDRLCVESGWGTSPEPLYIASMRGGVISYYENASGMQWFSDRVLSENQKGDEYFCKWSESYSNAVARLEKYWNRDCGIDELKQALSIAPDAFKGWNVFYYSAGDGRTPQGIRKKAVHMREKDVLGDEMNKCIERTLAKAYPHLSAHVAQITMDEIENPPSVDILQSREQNFIVHKYGNSIILETSTLEDVLKNQADWKIISHLGDASQSQVVGQAAFRGIAQGRVRVLLRRREIQEVQEGEILVTHMTTPDFVPAMKLAAAIVTDEGGITCHAAILARELKIPCVIGTKFGTEVFKDGDMVEVDADRGIVRKI